MHLVHHVSKAETFSDALPGTPQLLPWSYDLWYDPPDSPVTLNFSSPRGGDALTMVFEGTVCQAPVHILIDSGASHNFISDALCEQLGLTLHCSPGHVLCGGNTTVSSLGNVDVPVQMQSYSETLRLIAFPVAACSAFQVVLGQSWLRQHGALIDYGHDCVTFWHNGHQHALGSGIAGSQYAFLSAMEFRKAASEEGSQIFVMHVTDPSSSADYETSAPPDSGSAHELLQEYADVFSEIPPGLPPDRGIGHAINTGDNSPISQPMYRMSPKEKECAEKMVSDLLAKGWIRPSHSPYSAPILFVQKKDGSLRMCTDYRALNSKTIRDRYPLPRIDDLLDRLLGACIFSSLDLQSGYHQIRIQEKDVPKTAFITHCGLYEYQVLPFGLCNAPAAFQRVMNNIFGHLSFVSIYMDDILVFSKSVDEHTDHLTQVFQLLRLHKYYAKLSKCSFFQTEVQFLGHVVSGRGIHVNPDKVKAIQDWPEPRSASEVRSFLGLANFFRKFVMGFSNLALPLIKLSTMNHGFQFDNAAQQAFQGLKHALSHAPTLAVPDPSRHYELVCDASGFGCGAVLLQDERPVAFWSYKMTPAETRYHAGEQELLAVVKALEHWRHYLEGAVSLSVVTDHKPNITLNTKSPAQLSRRQVRWQQFLSRFDFQWVWRKGAHNVADPLSRHPAFLNSLLTLDSPHRDAPPSLAFLDRIATSYSQDPLFSDELKTRKFSFDGQYWRRNACIIVPSCGSLRNECISMHHDAVYSGHLGKDRTLDLILRHYWWPGIHSDVSSYVQLCDICQRTKAPPHKPAGLLQPLEIPANPWESISVDFVTQLPETLRGHTAIVTFVDRLTKMVHLVPTTTSIGGKEFADVFIQAIFSKHGMPLNIVSDRDPRFTSEFTKAFLLISLALSSTCLLLFILRLMGNQSA
jgi:hypothetical protein